MTHRGKSATCPQIVLEWIAWYPEGDLPSSVRGAIEAHAAECGACREEIATVSGEGDALPPELPDSARVFARVMEKIGAAPRQAAAVRAPLRARRVWSMRPSAAIAAGVLLAALSSTAAVVATRELGFGDALLETATSGAPASSTGGAHLDVVFRPEVPFATVQAALQAIGASVDAGPTPNGVVHLLLAEGTDARAAAARLESGEAPIALYAQPAP